MASGYGLSEGATVMERAGKNSGFKSHVLGGRDAEYYSAKSFRAQLANLHNTMERAGKTGKSKLKARIVCYMDGRCYYVIGSK